MKFIYFGEHGPSASPGYAHDGPRYLALSSTFAVKTH